MTYYIEESDNDNEDGIEADKNVDEEIENIDEDEDDDDDDEKENDEDNDEKEEIQTKDPVPAEDTTIEDKDKATTELHSKENKENLLVLHQNLIAEIEEAMRLSRNRLPGDDSQ